MMKKTVSILLIALTALATNVFNAGAQPTREPGKVKFQFNVKDVNDPNHGPVSDVQIRVFGKISTTSGGLIDKNNITTSGKSDDNGIAYASFSYTANGTSGAYVDGGYLWSPSGAAVYVPQQIFQLSVVTGGYSFEKNNSGYVRNLIYGMNASKAQVNDQTGGYGVYDNCYLNYDWVTQGAVIVFDVYVSTPSLERTLTFDTTTILNADQFTSVTVEKGTTVNAPTAIPEHKDHSDWTFEGWTIDGINVFTFPVTLNSNITLKPKWNNPNRKGVIDFQVYLWDHDSYREPPRVSTDFNYIYTGVNNGKISSNYSSYDLTGKGWTTIPVSGLRFKLRTYLHQRGAPHNLGPVGVPYTPGWENDNTISTVITDASGRATYEIPAENLQYLTAGFCIDCDPDPNCVATIIRDPAYGREPCVFDWDWMTLSAVQGAGVVGVRYILEGPRHADTGIPLAYWNDNDALLLTEDILQEGFKCTIYCYVLSAPCAQFDVNGGSMPSGTDSNLYPLQKFKPKNSAGVHVDPWVVKNPGRPSAPDPVHEEFAGWFEERYDLNDNRYESPVPFDFNQEIARSISLIAKYRGIVPMYTVRWAPDGWAGASDEDLYEKGTTYEVGSLPSFNHELPVNQGAKITGWDIYVKDDSGEKSFGNLGKYRYVKTVPQPQPEEYVLNPDDHETMRYIVYQGGSFWQSQYPVGSADQIYMAKFRTSLTVTKSGLKAGDSALFTVSNGSETRKIVIAGNSAGTAVSKTLYVDAGTWTVTEDMTWSWAYANSSSSQQVTVADGDHKTVTFENTAKTMTPQHGEHSVNNVFNK